MEHIKIFRIRLIDHPVKVRNTLQEICVTVRGVARLGRVVRPSRAAGPKEHKNECLNKKGSLHFTNFKLLRKIKGIQHIIATF